MVTKVQELTLLRQSNETLRAESSKSAERAQSLADKCGQLETSLAPLREQVAALEAEIETRDGQIKLLEVDNARWKARNEQVLVKYDRIDPQELQALKDKASTLEQEKQTLQEEYNRVRTQVSQPQTLHIVTELIPVSRLKGHSNASKAFKQQQRISEMPSITKRRSWRLSARAQPLLLVLRKRTLLPKKRNGEHNERHWKRFGPYKAIACDRADYL